MGGYVFYVPARFVQDTSGRLCLPLAVYCCIAKPKTIAMPYPLHIHCRSAGVSLLQQRPSLYGWAFLFLVLTSHALRAQIPAFPGALGYGALATGGRAGTVYHVTTLADSGPGSFRDAVSQPNRIVVFDVGGYISLLTAVPVKSNTTIAGQTAPGGGIGFKGGEISFASSTNIICRYIRIRPGSETESTTDDALSFYRATNVIVDHSSIEFAPWNNIDGVSDDWQNHPVNSITVQNSLIANPTGQQFGAHTEAVNGTWSWYYNIFANSHNRNPLAKINTVFVNNVLYNYGAGYTTHTSTKFKHDIINNYFIFGPANGSTDDTWFQVDKNQSIYYSGNMKDSLKDGALNGGPTTPFWYQGPGTILSAPWSPTTLNATIYSPQTAYRLTTSLAGALPRDQMDSLLLSQVYTLGNGTTGTGAGTAGPGASLYTSQAQTGLGNNGYGMITGGTAAPDTDQDGMPDYWEQATGSNPNSNDAMVLGADGYTLIEHYLNWLADPHAWALTGNSVDINLAQYTGGFAGTAPQYSVNNAVNGSITLLPDGHTVRFTPPAGFSGLGSFNFSVQGADSTSWSANVTIAVSSVSNPTAPAVFTKDIVVSLDSSGNAIITPAAIDSGSNDIYGIDSLGLDKSSFGCSDIGANTVTLTVKDNNGNEAARTAIVTVSGIKPGQPSIVPVDTIICNGDSALLTAVTDTAVRYQWYYQNIPVPGAVQKTYKATGAGIYNVTAISAQSCISGYSDTAIVSISADTLLTITADTTIYRGERVQLTTAGTQGPVVWTPGTGLYVTRRGAVYIMPHVTTTYTAMLTTPLGCKVSRSVTITVTGRPICRFNRLLLHHGDGRNDRLYIMDLKDYSNNRLQVYDFFGRPVYVKDNYNNDWDGSVNGRLLPSGVYYFTLMANHVVIATGTVTIVH